MRKAVGAGEDPFLAFVVGFLRPVPGCPACELAGGFDGDPRWSSVQ
jgi:hypothetical protein